MLATKPKSELQKKLLNVQTAAAHISLLTEVRSDFTGNPCHGGAIDAGMRALADQIDSEIDIVLRVLSKAEPEVTNV